MDNRGVSPVVEKLLVAGIVALFVTGSTTVLVGDVVPEAETVAGSELADRVLAQVNNRIEASLASADGWVNRRVEIELPASIDNAGYDVVLESDRLRLDHPNPAVATTSSLGVPSWVSVDPSRVDAGGDPTVTVRGAAGNLTVGLEESP